jgi:hypothetical protein
VIAGHEREVDRSLELMFATMQADAALIRGAALSQRLARELGEVQRLRSWIERESHGRTEATRAETGVLNALLRRWFTKITLRVGPEHVVIAVAQRKTPAPTAPVQVCIERAAWTRQVRPHRRQLIHGFWERAEIIGALQAFADRHGRSPTWVDWTRAGSNHPQAKTVYRHFKSWNQALRRAGLQAIPPPLHYAWDQKEIIHALRASARKRGRPPVSTEWARAKPGHPSADTVRAHFGHWGDALGAAGLEPTRRPPHRSEPWRDEEICEALRGWTVAHGRPPVSLDWIRSASDHPQSNTVRNHFGSWEAALVAAGHTKGDSSAGAGRFREPVASRISSQVSG